MFISNAGAFPPLSLQVRITSLQSCLLTLCYVYVLYDSPSRFFSSFASDPRLVRRLLLFAFRWLIAMSFFSHVTCVSSFMAPSAPGPRSHQQGAMFVFSVLKESQTGHMGSGPWLILCLNFYLFITAPFLLVADIKMFTSQFLLADFRKALRMKIHLTSGVSCCSSRHFIKNTVLRRRSLHEQPDCCMK